VELMRELDLEVAGEYILMAATLIQIKIKMLLPKDPEAMDEEEGDPRADLVRQLLEYKRFKTVAESLSDMESRQIRLYPRGYFDDKPYRKAAEADQTFILKDVSLFDLLSSFKKVLDNRPKESFHSVKELGVTIEEQIDYVLNHLAEKERVTFFDLVDPLPTRVAVIMTFMAILELIRTRRLAVMQASTFDDIWIVRREQLN
jgi:segregation and condensation protein A